MTLPMLFDGAGVEQMHLDPVPAADFEVVRDTSPAPDMGPALAARRQLNAEIDEDGFARDTGTRVGEAVLLPDDASAGDLKWAVQVASFERRDNAVARRDGLLSDGYAAFLSSAKRDGREITRVAVGPFIDRDDAARLKAELDDRYPEETVIVRFGY